MNYYGNNYYNPYLMNPMLNQQNRLNNMEQQYFNQNQMYNSNLNNVQQNNTILKGRPVTSYDEANSCMIDLDGSLFIFPDIGNNKIYTKQVGMDGTAPLIVYERVNTQSSNKSSLEVNSEPYRGISENEVNALKQRVSDLERQVEEYVKSFAAFIPIVQNAESIGSNAADVSEQSGYGESNGNGKRKK